ncbi:hypothetical protein V8Z81_25040 [Priestia megaterium]|uniref:hypothetical protein n=1 Tax=Priestia megaterium TaxID=1404 RepID=UPI0030D53D44
MSEQKKYYKRVAKDIQKWIDNKFPKDRNVNEGKGPARRFEDKDLKEIALEVKTALRGEKIYPSLLEKITGIGRQTWKRRISQELESLNTPVINGRKFGLDDDDEINHVNIEFIVEKYAHKPSELIKHLYYLEESRINLYSKVKELQQQNEALNKHKEENEKLVKQNKTLKEELHHYVHLSNNLFVSSYYPDLRNKYGVEVNVIDVNSNSKKTADIINLNTLFPSSKELDTSKEKVEELIEPKARRAGEELVAGVMDEFSELMDE